MAVAQTQSTTTATKTEADVEVAREGVTVTVYEYFLAPLPAFAAYTQRQAFAWLLGVFVFSLANSSTGCRAFWAIYGFASFQLNLVKQIR